MCRLLTKDIDREFKINFQKYSINHEVVDSGSGNVIIRKSLESINKMTYWFIQIQAHHLTKWEKKRFLEYIDLINDSDKGNLRFRMEFIENEWTTKEILITLT